MLRSWLKENNTDKVSSVLWNSLGVGIATTQAAVILIFVSHIYGLVIAGIITISYAFANVILTAAKYGIRNYQTTDIIEEYKFADYLYVRIITVCACFLLSVVFLCYKTLDQSYIFEKSLIILEVILLKLVDAFEDVFLGRLQQIDKFIIAAKVMAVRQAIVTLCICFCIALRNTIAGSIGIGIAVSILVEGFLIKAVLSECDVDCIEWNGTKISRLIHDCFPLCVGNTLAIYVGNIPKYAIDNYSTDDIQAIFGYLTLPVFVVTLSSQFIYLPFVKEFGDEWEKGDLSSFFSKILYQVLFISFMAVMILVLGLTVGLKILSALYNVSLNQFNAEFMLLMVGGCLYAFSFFLTIPLTAMRKQRIIEAGYVLSAVAAWFIQRPLVVSFDMVGAGLLYIVVNVIAFIVFAMSLYRGRLKQ